MTTKSAENRRTGERRVDKITMKARIMARTLKRTIGASAAQRYLEKSGYSGEVIHDMMSSGAERRGSRRRAENRPARFQYKQANIRINQEDGSFRPLNAEDIGLLYQLRLANDSESVFIRICDLPAKFVRFALIDQGPRGARITKRGLTILHHWTRAKALRAICSGEVVEPFEDGVKTWLKNNRFIDIVDEALVVTPRGVEWLETRLKTLTELGQFPT